MVLPPRPVVIGRAGPGERRGPAAAAAGLGPWSVASAGQRSHAHPRTGPTVRRALPSLLLTLALVLTGCRFDVVADLVIERDGTGQASVELRIDADALAQLDQLGVDPTAELAAAAGEVPAWEVVRRTEDDGSLTVRLSRTTAEPAAAAAALRELSEGLTPRDPALLVDLDLDLDEDGAVTVDGTAELRSPATAGASVDGTPVGPDREALARLVAEVVEARLSVTVPGEVLEHDADTLEGGTLTWELAPDVARDVRVVAAAPGAVPAWLLLVGAVVVLVLALGVLAWRWRRRRASAPR
jgi:hypothetical protein